MKKIDRSVFLFTLGAIALSSGIAMTGCSPNIEGGKKGELYVSEQSVTLQVSKQTKPQLQSEFLVRNEGTGPFDITGIEVKNGPDGRVVLLGDKSETSPCNELSVGTSCYKEGPPSMPISLTPSASVPVLFAVTGGSQDLKCMEAPDYVPAALKANYCGEIKITTNSGTNNDLVKDGVATVYLQYNGGSGKAEVNPGIIKIEGILPSTTYTKKFKIKNVGSEPLTINSLSFNKSLPKDVGSVSVSPSSQSTINKDASNEYTITYTSGTSSDFNESIELVINSTSVESAKLALFLTTKEPPAPILSYDKSMLNFDAADEQEFTITNKGSAILLIRSMSLVSANGSTDPNEWYEILDKNDTRVTEGIRINSRDSKTFKVHYLKSATSKNKDHVAYLVIRSNDNYYGADSKIILAAINPPGPFGEVYPVGLYVNKEDDTRDQKRMFVVRNLGTEALDISKFYVDGSEYTSIFDFSDPSGSTISTATILGNSISTFTLDRTTTSWAQPTKNNGKVKFTADNDLSDKFTEDRHRLSEGINLELDGSALEGTLEIEVLGSPVEEKLVSLKVKPGTNFTADYFKDNDVDCLWMLTKRPGKSRLFIFDRTKCSAPFVMRPDVSGDYTIYVRPDVKVGLSEKIYGYATKAFTVGSK